MNERKNKNGKMRNECKNGRETIIQECENKNKRINGLQQYFEVDLLYN